MMLAGLKNYGYEERLAGFLSEQEEERKKCGMQYFENLQQFRNRKELKKNNFTHECLGSESHGW